MPHTSAVRISLVTWSDRGDMGYTLIPVDDPSEEIPSKLVIHGITAYVC